MSEIYGVLTPLGGEIKRDLYFKIFKKYDNPNIFEDCFKKSIYSDTSQINLNFLSAILSQYCISKFGIKKTYFICISLIFVTMIITSFNSFYIKDEIEKNHDYKNWQLISIFLQYISIYFFGGIIAFIPAQIFVYDETQNFKNCLAMLFTLTLAVIVKNIFHFYCFHDISLRLSLILCSFLFLLFSLIYLYFLLQSKTSTKNDDNDNDNIINKSGKKEEDLYYDINEAEDSFEINNENLIPISDYEQDEDINVEKNKDGKNNMIKRYNNKILSYTASFSRGYLNFEFERVNVSIKIKGACEFFYSLFNTKFILLLAINFFSRFQKVKFKSDLKNQFDSEDNES